MQGDDKVNKDIEELLNKLKNKAEHYILYDYEVNLLLSYIEQLENNKEKTIELLNELSNLYDDNYTISDKAKDIIDILKGDSDE